MESKTINNVIKGVRQLFNEVRSNLSHKEINRIRYKLYKKEAVYNYLKEKEQKDGLKDEEKIVLKNVGKYLKKLNNDLKKLNKYHDNVMYGLNYLFNEEDYYEPKEIKSAFDGSYTLYESGGDKDAKLALWEYFEKIMLYLINMIDYHKTKGEWKIQLVM